MRFFGEYGGAVAGEASYLSIHSNTFTGNTSDNIGGTIYASGGALNARGNKFIQNSAGTGSSVYVDTGVTVESLAYNCFAGNDTVSVFNAQTGDIDATQNWWNAADGPSGAGPGHGDAVGERILYQPFESEPFAGCPPGILVAMNQTVILYHYEPNTSFSLEASGGTPGYTFAILAQPAHGTLSGTIPDLTYTPDPGFVGVDSVQFQVTDAVGTTSVGTVTLLVESASIVVDSLDQEVPFVDNGNCTLSEAIQAANTDTAVDGCAAGDGEDLIGLAPDAVYVLSQPDNDGTHGPNGLPIITSAIAIHGNNATIMRGDAPDTPSFRILEVNSQGVLSLNGLTLRNGRIHVYPSMPDGEYVDNGGALWNSGTSILEDCTLTGNFAMLYGGAIYSEGSLTITRSSIVGNQSVNMGGGLAVWRSTVISDSVISENTASKGAGIYHSAYPLRISGTTFADNVASSAGGGIYNSYGATDVQISDSILRYNQGGAFYTAYRSTWNDPPSILTHNCLMDRSIGVVDNFTAGSIVATGNWWGSPSGPGGDGPGTGTIVSGENIEYEPFLTEPILGCGVLSPLAIEQTVYAAYETPVDFVLEAADGIPPYTFDVETAFYGTLTDTAPNLTYTPASGFSGVDTFHFTVTDTNGDSSTAKITVRVAADLIATDQALSTPSVTPLNIHLSISGGREPYTFTVSDSASGTLTGTPPDLIYTPDSEFTGIDSFTFDVVDANGDAGTGTITITVSKPLATQDQTLRTTINTAVAFTLSARDGRPPYTFAFETQPAHGVILGTGANRTYVPYTGFSGTDSFVFRVTDQNNTQVTGRITVEVMSSALDVPPGDAAALRAAINTANAESGSTTIWLGAGSDYTLAEALPAITGNIVLVGNGATLRGTADPALAVDTTGSLTVDRLMIADGAIYNAGTLLVINSTLYENSGIQNQGGNVQVINSTVSGNQGTGIHTTKGLVSLTNSTIAYNSGGGLVNIDGTVTLENTIIAYNNCTGTITSKGHNIDSGTTCGLTGLGDLTGTDPALAPLHNNGGPTLTHALYSGSAATDAAANDACYWADQRGGSRPQDGDSNGSAICDIGSVERSINPPAPPDLVSPADGARTTHNQPTFTWNMTPYGTWYEFQLDTDANFSSPDQEAALEGLSYTAMTLADDTTYYWRVRTIDSEDQVSAWSAAWSLTIETTSLNAPDLRAPKDRAITSDTTPTFTWKSVKGAKRYHLQIARAGDFGAGVLVFETDDPAKTRYTVLAALPYGAYYWRVRAQNPAGAWSDWSAVHTFTITLLKTPANGGFTTDTTPTFRWIRVKGTAQYQIQVASDADFDTRVIDQAKAAPRLTPDVALAHGQYYWRVSIDGGATWTPAWVFTVTPRPPARPVLTAPAHKAQVHGEMPAFSWESVPDGAAYQLQIDNQGSFKSPDVDMTISGLTYIPDALADSGTYYWRVRALNSLGVAGQWSRKRSFTMGGPDRPALASPADKATLGTNIPVLTWTDVDGLADYQIEIAADKRFRSVVERATITGLSHTPGALADGLYYWRARALTPGGTGGDWSPTWRFTVDTTGPAAPVLKAPRRDSGTPDTTPTFKWRKPKGATGYQLQVFSDPALSVNVLDTPVSGTRYTHPAPLPFGRYYWRVQAQDAVGNWGGWSHPATFTLTVLKAPKDVSTTTDTTLTFTWASVTGAAGYQFQLASEETFTTPLIAQPVPGTRYMPDTPLAHGQYYWRVSADNGATWTPAWSLTLTPGLPGKPKLTAPRNNVLTSDNTPSLTWTAVNDGNVYQVQIGADRRFNSLIQEIEVLGSELAYTALSLPDGRYYWRVRALNAVGAPGKWSARRTFIVDTTPPAVPALAAPASDARVTNPKLILQWNKVKDAVRYELQLDTDPAFLLPPIDAGKKVTYKPPAPLAQAAYYWRVRAIDRAGNVSEWSMIQVFHLVAGSTIVTTPAPLPTPIPTQPAPSHKPVDEPDTPAPPVITTPLPVRPPKSTKEPERPPVVR